MVVVLGLKELEEMRLRYIDKYREVLRKYEGFETCGLGSPSYFNGLMENICDDRNAPCCGLVLLYARLGLHRFNFLQGKNLVLSKVNKYNRTYGTCPAATFYVTLKAKDPARRGSLRTFQTKVIELKSRRFVLKCSIARLVGETKKTKAIPTFRELYGGKFLHVLMPELPSENPFDNSDRFYVLKKSEVQAHDWIQLYLDLAVATTNRTYKMEAPTNLKIMQVSIETTQDPKTPNQGHNVYDATFYIRYKDPCEARVGKDVDRVAIIRRILDKNTHDLRLIGRTESSAAILPEKAEKNPCEALVGKDVDVITSSLDENMDELSNERSQ